MVWKHVVISFSLLYLTSSVRNKSAQGFQGISLKKGLLTGNRIQDMLGYFQIWKKDSRETARDSVETMQDITKTQRRTRRDKARQGETRRDRERHRETLRDMGRDTARHCETWGETPRDTGRDTARHQERHTRDKARQGETWRDKARHGETGQDISQAHKEDKRRQVPKYETDFTKTKLKFGKNILYIYIFIYLFIIMYIYIYIYIYL